MKLISKCASYVRAISIVAFYVRAGVGTNGKRNIVKVRLLLIGLLTGVSGILYGCDDAADLAEGLRQAVEYENQAVRDSTIVMAGSTSMEQFANMAAESFMAAHPGITVTVEFTGSSAGVEAVLAGRADIGNSSRSLRQKEQVSGAVGNIIAIDGIAVVTDRANPVTSLTVEQLAGIYTGRIRNWNEVGGADIAIVVTGREAGSGTRNTFEGRLGIRDLCLYANELDSAGAVMARVAATPGAIGYVSFDVLNDMVAILSINGVEAAEKNVKAGDYLLWQPYIMVTDGEIDEQKESVRMFFDYLYSEEGKQLIRAAGLIVPDFYDGTEKFYSFTGLIPHCLQRSEGRSQGWIPRSLQRGDSLTI